MIQTEAAFHAAISKTMDFGSHYGRTSTRCGMCFRPMSNGWSRRKQL